MKKNISISWKKNMAFEADIDGHKLMMDAKESVGGQNLGPTPKPLLLASLGGCTGMDVISLARKMRQEVESFEIDLESEILDDFPQNYLSIKLIYKFKGKDLDPKKIQKAVDLSQNRYCGVSATLRETVKLSYEIQIL